MKSRNPDINFLKKVSSLILLTFMVFPITASGAVLYIDPDAGVVSPDQMFSVDIRVDEQGECLNVFDVKLHYPADMVEATSVSRGRSILSLWTVEPFIDNNKGEIKFTGGVPGGYCGRIPGDPELTNVLATIVFQPLGHQGFSGNVEIVFDERSSVLLSDGLGTFAETQFINASYETGEEATVNADEWLEVIREDGRPPVSFDVILMQDESVFEGKYYIVFSTTDKGSGLSHYEVKEEDIDREGFIRGSREEALFERAQSPYLLKDQTLNSRITVRAVDNVGNHRVAFLTPDEDLRISDDWPFFATISKIVSQHPISFAFTMMFIAFLIFSLFYLRQILIRNPKRSFIEGNINHDPGS